MITFLYITLYSPHMYHCSNWLLPLLLYLLCHPHANDAMLPMLRAKYACEKRTAGRFYSRYYIIAECVLWTCSRARAHIYMYLLRGCNFMVAWAHFLMACIDFLDKLNEYLKKINESHCHWRSQTHPKFCRVEFNKEMMKENETKTKKMKGDETLSSEIEKQIKERN